MRIAVTTESDTYTLEVSEDLELENFKVLCEAESGIPSADIVVAFNGRRLTDDKKPLKDYGIKDGDLLMVMSGASILQRAAERMHQMRGNPTPMDVNQFDFGSIRVPGTSGKSAGQPNRAGNTVSSSHDNAANVQGQDQSKTEGEGGEGVMEQDDLGLGESAGGSKTKGSRSHSS